jgi:polyferredoxin/thioredoxin-like negative regulator of GroEL
MGRWRAAVLIALHVAAAIHIAHWLSSGKTVSPLEPSETIYTFSRGLLNAGAVLFTLAVLSTFVVGRFFCGWGCHLIALQDLSTWILHKFGIRPKPLRSRLLIFVPLGAAIYMFGVPIVYRHVVAPCFDLPVPAYRPHFVAENFWDTFPGWAGAVVTFLVCGGLIVWVLGNKGFCTYACPYGGFFGVADRLSPGRIRVTDACEQCGHCTAACTSNVRVHEEVRDHGMVVDPGCMKCLDCVSVCPNDALYFGFSDRRSAATRDAAKKSQTSARRRDFDYTWPEELLMAAAFMATLVCVRGVYDFVPFLLALGLASITALLTVTFARSFYHPNLRLQRWQIRRVGRTTAGGWAFRALMVGWFVLVGHSYWMTALRTQAMEHMAAGREAYAKAGDLTDESRRSFEAGLSYLTKAERFGLLSFADLQQQIASAHYYLANLDAARTHFERAVAHEPYKYIAARYELAQLAHRRGDVAEAERQLRAIVRHSPEYNDAAEQLTALLASQKRSDEILPLWESFVQRRREIPRLRLALAALYDQAGAPEKADAALKAGAIDLPDEPSIPFEQARRAAERGQAEETIAALKATVTAAPDFRPGWEALAETFDMLNRAADAAQVRARLAELAEAQRWAQAEISKPRIRTSGGARLLAMVDLVPDERPGFVPALQALEAKRNRSRLDDLKLLALYRAGRFETRIPAQLERVRKHADTK